MLFFPWLAFNESFQGIICVSQKMFDFFTQLSYYIYIYIYKTTKMGGKFIVAMHTLFYSLLQ